MLDPQAQGVARPEKPGPSEKLGCAHVGLHPGTEALAGLAEPHT